MPGIYELPALYDRMVVPGPCEAFYRDLARQTGGPVLEVACGTGRLTIPLARDGHAVVGLDASPAMLARARAKARAEEVEITFLAGDMRCFDLGRRFALVVVSCNSLAHLTTNEELEASFGRMRDHLASDGLLAFDIANPDLRALAGDGGPPIRLDTGPNPSTGIPVEEELVYEPVQQIRIAHWRVCDPGTGVDEIAPLRLRQIFPQELLLLLKAAGLRLVARYGDFAGNPLGRHSLNQICLARRA